MKLITISAGFIQENVYIYYDETTLRGVIVDPGEAAEKIIEFLEQHKIKIEAILLTHGHFDHIGAVAQVKAFSNAPVVASKEEIEILQNPEYNFSSHGTPKAIRNLSITPDVFVEDGQQLNYADIQIKVIATPGHTPGGLCYYHEKESVLFSGDTLFLDSVGRTDLTFGNHEHLSQSIHHKLFTLPEDVNVFPGHGYQTTIGHEKKYNRYI